MEEAGRGNIGQNREGEKVEEGEIRIEVSQIDSMYQELKKIFQRIVQIIKTDQKVDQYCRRIDATAAELSIAYGNIIASCQQLRVKISSSKIIERSVHRTFTFLLELLKTKNIDDLDSKGKTVWFLQIQTKLHCSLEFLHAFSEEEDITNSPPTSYPQVWSKIVTVPANDPNKTKKQFKSLKNMLHVVTSAILNEEQYQFAFIRKITFGLSFPRYMIMNDSSKLRSFVFYRKPTLKIAQKIWNVPELGATRELSKITFEGIKTNKKIYLPTDGDFSKRVDIFTEDLSKITVRILYNKKIRYFNNQEAASCCSKEQNEVKFIDSVLIHLHGGGFVALSSRSMQNYTRKWANELQIPVLSVDYRMPPDFPFPQAPLDCLLVYRFIVHHIHNYMNIKPTNIYIAGDSAGGNLTCSLTGLILKHKQPIPKALYLAYPATDVRIRFTDSKLYSMTDPLLWPSMLLLCLHSYLQGDLKQADDPMASPILLTQQYVSQTPGDKRFPLKWPRTIVTVGNRDPLCNDSLLLMQKMVQSNIDCQCVLYDQLSHGYLSIAMFVKQCEKTLDDSVQHLKKLMQTK